MKQLNKLAAAFFGFAILAMPASAAVREPDSQRLEQAKDFIADEQWTRAIDGAQAGCRGRKGKEPG